MCSVTKQHGGEMENLHNELRSTGCLFDSAAVFVRPLISKLRFVRASLVQREGVFPGNSRWTHYNSSCCSGRPFFFRRERRVDSYTKVSRATMGPKRTSLVFFFLKGPACVTNESHAPSNLFYSVVILTKQKRQTWPRKCIRRVCCVLCCDKRKRKQEANIEGGNWKTVFRYKLLSLFVALSTR